MALKVTKYPMIVGSHQQKTTHYKHHAPGKKKPTRFDTATLQQHIILNGSLTSTNPSIPSAAYGVMSLAGPTAPTVTGGYANYNVIPRPQRVGMTVLQGYDPFTLTVSLLLDATYEDYLDDMFAAGRIDAGDIVQHGDDPSTYGKNAHTGVLKAAIEALDWMGGRGNLFASDGGVGGAGVGVSPLITLASVDGNGNVTNLISPDALGVKYVLQTLTWDPNAQFNRAGWCTRQLVTLVLYQYVGGPFDQTADSPAVRAKSNAASAGKTIKFTSTDALNTVFKIAAKFAPGSNIHQAAQLIIAANTGNPKVGPSTTRKLAKNTVVVIPYNVEKNNLG